MAYIDNQLLEFKKKIEKEIIERGSEGKESIIRSSSLINLIHDAVKKELINCGVKSENIYPPFLKTKPELKLAGFLKQKDQDICIVPSNIEKVESTIKWGPLAFKNKIDLYGSDYTTNTLVINVRSQMSSLAKNADTLFERTFAEALNLRMKYPKIVLGEVYLIPTHEYDDEAVKNKRVSFKVKSTDIERYISFFDSINNYNDEIYKYDRCALLIVDFNRDKPRLFVNSRELKEAGLISSDFPIEYAKLNFLNFASDILSIYGKRFNIKNICQ